MSLRVAVFELSGDMAHFRKFYTNSSSLTYPVPPRSVLAGIIAGVLGRERDTYYDEFLPDVCNIGLAKLEPTRAIMQTINYMKITTPKHFTFPEDHTQIPFEILVGYNNKVRYRIYFHHKDDSLMDNLADFIIRKKAIYPPYLGSASFMGELTWVGEFQGKWQNDTDWVFTKTVIPIGAIMDKEISIWSMNNDPLMILKEKMPRYFKSGREIGEVTSYIFEDRGRALKVKLRESYVVLSMPDGPETILFL